MPAKFTVDVYYNTYMMARLHGYTEGDWVKLQGHCVFGEDKELGCAQEAAQAAFIEYNREDMDACRSMSTGDVVRVHLAGYEPLWMACAASGWQRIPQPIVVR